MINKIRIVKLKATSLYLNINYEVAFNNYYL